jgi:AAA+ ATPase superfamily predicted ATPase
MPDFPTYYGPSLPKVLNPLNPAHYWLLLKWIFFQPNRLKHYLHQVDPELYRATGLRSLFKTVHLAAYRNLYLIAVITSLIATISIAFGTSVTLGTSTRWIELLVGVAVGVWFGVTFGVAGGVGFGVAVGVAVGVTGGATSGVAFGVAFGVIGDPAFGLIFGIVGGIVLGVTVSVAFYAGFGIAVGMTVGIGFGVAGGMVGAVVFGMTSGMATGVITGLVFGVACIIGASRLLFWPFEWLWIMFTRVLSRTRLPRLSDHPVFWDELAVWPLPSLGPLLQQQLSNDFEAALHVSIKISANPFQRWAVQRVMSDWLASQLDALAILDRLVHSALADEYLSLPVRRDEFRDFPAARVILTGEIGQKPTDGRQTYQTSRIERLVWVLTRSLRRTQPTPLSQFSAMLYELFCEEAKLKEQNNADVRFVQRFHSVYDGIRDYPHGSEISDSWISLAAFLEGTTLDHSGKTIPLQRVGLAYKQLTWIFSLEQPYLVPEIVASLKALGDVSRSVEAFLQSTSLPSKTVALNQAAGGLQELVAYVEKELWPPERALYLSLIKHWQSLIAAEQGHLGENALRQMSPSERLAIGFVDRTSDVWQRPGKPLANPYIAGDPVMPPLFVGRRDIFTKIAEIWRAKANPDSIILYGHRRMGKSSILRNLDQAAPDRLIAYMNLQGETSFVATTADLLLALADRIYAEVKRARPEAVLDQPPTDQFTTQFAAQTQFNRFMEQVRTALGDSGLILALDEFEAIEEAVRDKKVGKEIYQFLRAKTQEPWITVVFGGLHTLDEMSRDYAQPFYGSYQNIVVSYLAPEDAYHLITNPTPDFTVNYEPAAVERIIAATGGQPYLVQLVCRDALDHLNHELFDEHKEREVKLTIADVEAVLGDDLFRRGTGYFDGVWTQVSEAAQQDLLRCMAQREEAWTLAELEAVAHLTPDELRQHLQLAQRRDILRQRDGTWEFCVPLMRRWIHWKGQ